MSLSSSQPLPEVMGRGTWWHQAMAPANHGTDQAVLSEIMDGFNPAKPWTQLRKTCGPKSVEVCFLIREENIPQATTHGYFPSNLIEVRNQSGYKNGNWKGFL